MQKEQAFSALIDTELPMLRRVVWQILRNAADTDEVIQDALLKAWQKFSDFQNAARFSTWVYRIAVNTAYSFKRERAKEASKLHSFAHSEEGRTPDYSNALVALENAMAALPENLRQALLLTLVEELPGKRAAEIAGCTLDTLYWRVKEAKNLLKKALAEVNYEI